MGKTIAGDKVIEILTVKINGCLEYMNRNMKFSNAYVKVWVVNSI